MSTAPQLPTFWHCDSCGQRIENAEDGWVEWISSSTPDGQWFPVSRGMRIVHHQTPRWNDRTCQYLPAEVRGDWEGIGDDSLESFMGPDGLMRLLEMLQQNLPQAVEIIEIIKRIHIPRYEEVRQDFEEALGEGIIELNVLERFWRQRDFESIIEWRNDQQNDGDSIEDEFDDEWETDGGAG